MPDSHDAHTGHSPKISAAHLHPNTSAQSHAHAHGHTSTSPHGRAFFIAITLNTLFVALEFGYGFVANSTALMADAGHNLSDVLGLLLAWAATVLARKAPDARFTYGLRSSSILAALANAVLLLVACGAIGWEAAQRLLQPPAVAGLTVIWVAAAGIVVNGVSALLFMKGSQHDINIRGAYLHMAADAAVSLGVVLAGALMLFTGWLWVDPAISLVIVAVIVLGTWGLLRASLHLALNAVPPHIDMAAVAEHLKSAAGVADIHDLHIWGMSTTESALTVHLVMPAGHPGDAALDRLAQGLSERFRIQHSTLQIEHGTTAHGCSLHAPLAATPVTAHAH